MPILCSNHQLTNLDLDRNEIKMISEEIISLTKLKQISMDLNELQSLPVAFNKWRAL